MPATSHFPESGVRTKNKGTLCPGVLTGFDVSFSSLSLISLLSGHSSVGGRQEERREGGNAYHVLRVGGINNVRFPRLSQKYIYGIKSSFQINSQTESMFGPYEKKFESVFGVHTVFFSQAFVPKEDIPLLFHLFFCPFSGKCLQCQAKEGPSHPPSLLRNRSEATTKSHRATDDGETDLINEENGERRGGVGRKRRMGFPAFAVGLSRSGMGWNLIRLKDCQKFAKVRSKQWWPLDKKWWILFPPSSSPVAA